MKRIINNLLLSILSLFIFPIVAKADVAAPESSSYIVTVAKQEGTILYDWEMKEILTIPYNEKLTILFETDIKGSLYGDVSYNGKYGYIKLNDTIANPEDIDFSNLEENELNDKYYTLKETTMYNGPSPTYGIIKDIIIPSNTTLEYKYYSILSDQIGWIYTEYNGTKGWVYVHGTPEYSYYENVEKTVAIKAKPTDKILILSEEEKLYKEPNIESEEVYTLKSNNEYTYTHYIELEWPYTAFYINDGKAKGWYLVDNSHYDNSKHSIRELKYIYILNKDGIKLKDNYKDKKYNDIIVPEKTILKSEYSVRFNEEIYYEVEYKDKKYWMANGYINDYLMSFYQYNIKPVKEIKTYSDLKDYDSETETTIPKDTELKSFVFVHDYNDTLESWYYIEYNNEYYWIHDNKDLNIQQSYFEEESEKKEPSKRKEESDTKELTPKQIGLICTGGAIILALVAVVTIKLINKKKKEVVQ